MKIVIIPNSPEMIGRHYSMAKALAARGHEIHYMLWELPHGMRLKQFVHHLLTSLFARTYDFESLHIHKVSRLPYFWPVVNGWLFALQTKRVFKRINADFIFSEAFSNETYVPKKLPVIYDLADDYYGPADVFGSKLYKFAFTMLNVKGMMRRNTQNALAVTAVSEMLIKYARQYNDTVVNLPNGVDGEVIKNVKSDMTTYPTNMHSLVYASSFGRWSRVIDTMEAVRDLRKEFPDIDLTMAGGGPESDTIRQFIKDNQAEDYIHFLGSINDRKLWFSTINKGAIGLNISAKNKWRDAAHPIKVLEYSAMAKPVVSTDLEEVKALALSNVYIFSDNSGDGLIPTLRRALHDSELRADYRELSDQVIAKYDWQKIADDLVALAQSLLKDRTK